MNNTSFSSDILALLTRAGQLNYTLDKAILLVTSKYPEAQIGTLKRNLSTPGSAEYNAYHTGLQVGMFDVESGLLDVASKGDAEAVKALDALRTGLQVGEAVNQSFFPDIE